MMMGKGWAARDHHCRRQNLPTCGVIILGTTCIPREQDSLLARPLPGLAAVFTLLLCPHSR